MYQDRKIKELSQRSTAGISRRSFGIWENMLRECMYSKQERGILQFHPHNESL